MGIGRLMGDAVSARNAKHIVVENDRVVLSATAMKGRARQLMAMANELMAIAADLADGDGVLDLPFPLASSDASDDLRWSDIARAHYRDRRLRAQMFDDSALFGEPAWDLLLDLFIAARERKRVPVTSACIGAAVPTTTALRWLAILESRGLVLRDDDASDARRIFVRLSPEAYAKMAEYFARSSHGQCGEEARLPQGTKTNGVSARPFMLGL